MPLTLRLRDAISLPVVVAEFSPSALTALPAAERARRPVAVGNGSAALGDLFRIEGDGGDGHVVVEGDLRAFRRLGAGMDAGRLSIVGDVGEELGAGMSGGRIELAGSAGDWAGAELRGGTLQIRGDAGHGLGAALPGSRLGMRDGVILVAGSVGDDAGLALRRGLIAIAGAAGDGLGHALIAGSIFAFGAVGRYAGIGMKRGTIALFGPSAPALLPTFEPSTSPRPPFLTVYLKALQALGFPVPAAAFSGTPTRYNGDRAARGQGEILVATGQGGGTRWT